MSRLNSRIQSGLNGFWDDGLGGLRELDLEVFRDRGQESTLSVHLIIIMSVQHLFDTDSIRRDEFLTDIRTLLFSATFRHLEQLLALNYHNILLRKFLRLGVSSLDGQEVILIDSGLDLGLLIQEAIELLNFNSDLRGLLEILEVAVALFGEAVADLLVHVELVGPIGLSEQPVLPLGVAPGAEHSSEVLECLLEALLLGFREFDVVLFDLGHASLDVKFDGMDLLDGVLLVNLVLRDLLKLSQAIMFFACHVGGWPASGFLDLGSASADLVVPSLEAAVLFRGLSLVLSVELAAVALLILSV